MKETKKCMFCDSEYENNTNEKIFYNSNGCCEECKEIQQLYEFINNYLTTQDKKMFLNPIYRQNILDGENLVEFRSSPNDKFLEVKRSAYVREIVEKIDHVRNLLAIDISGYFEILDSIYEERNIFWNETGNLLRYVHNSSFEYIVIKLKSLLLEKSSKYSIRKIKNLLMDNRANDPGNKILKKIEFKNGDFFIIEYDSFPMAEYFEKIDLMIKKYSPIINAIADYRDNRFAHIGELKNKESTFYLSYVNIKRIFNMLKLIYDGLLISIAPDKFYNIYVDQNIHFAHLDQIVKEYKKVHRNPSN